MSKKLPICYLCKKPVKPEDEIRYYGGINHKVCRDKVRKRLGFGKRE